MVSASADRGLFVPHVAGAPFFGTPGKRRCDSLKEIGLCSNGVALKSLLMNPGQNILNMRVVSVNLVPHWQ